MTTIPPDPRFGTRKGIAGWPRKWRESWTRHTMRNIILALVAAAALVLGWIFLREPIADLFDKKEKPVAAAKVQPGPVPAPAPQAKSVASTAAAPPAATPAAEPAFAPFTVQRTSSAPPPPARAATAPCKPGNTGKPFQWRVSGGNPYAQNEEEAFSDAKLDQMLACNNVPQEHWVAIKAHLRDTNNGTKVTLAEGTRLDSMMSGAASMYTDVIVLIKGGQRALQYDFEVDGVRYTFILPLRCWNWARPAPPKHPPCVTIEFNHAGYEGGRVYWGAEEGPLEDDRCNAMSQGEGRWVSWTRICKNCAVTAYESRSYASTARRQRLRFSEAVWRNGVRICLESREGYQTCYVSVPGPGKAWAGRHYVKIEDNLWRLCRRPPTL